MLIDSLLLYFFTAVAAAGEGDGDGDDVDDGLCTLLLVTLLLLLLLLKLLSLLGVATEAPRKGRFDAKPLIFRIEDRPLMIDAGEDAADEEEDEEEFSQVSPPSWP